MMKVSVISAIMYKFIRKYKFSWLFVAFLSSFIVAWINRPSFLCAGITGSVKHVIRETSWEDQKRIPVEMLCINNQIYRLYANGVDYSYLRGQEIELKFYTVHFKIEEFDYQALEWTFFRVSSQLVQRIREIKLDGKVVYSKDKELLPIFSISAFIMLASLIWFVLAFRRLWIDTPASEPSK